MKHFSLSLLVFEIFDWITSDGPPCIFLAMTEYAHCQWKICDGLALGIAESREGLSKL